MHKLGIVGRRPKSQVQELPDFTQRIPQYAEVPPNIEGYLKGGRQANRVLLSRTADDPGHMHSRSYRVQVGAYLPHDDLFFYLS